jgi:hypothetical protein
MPTSKADFYPFGLKKSSPKIKGRPQPGGL